MIRCFGFGSSNIHGFSMGENPKKKQDTAINGWHHIERQKMTIDFKGFFRNEDLRQRKINNLEELESRRWVKTGHCYIAFTIREQ